MPTAVTAARDLVRTLVLKTNPYWPFTRCNHWPYAGALYAFVRAVRTRPEIQSIYLRLQPQRAWIPGLSDIDLTLVLQGGMSLEREYDTLQSFWKTFVRLKRVFPMLGEVEILDEGEVSTWLTWTISDPQGPAWTVLHGRPNHHVLSIRSPHWRRRALNSALVYLTLLPRCFAQRDSSLSRQDILRRVSKIMRLLEPILVEAGQPHLAVPARSVDPADLVAGALKALEAAVIHVAPPGARHAAPAGRRDSLLTILRGQTRQTMLVIDDGLDREMIAGRLRSRWSDGRGPSDPPLVLPHSLLGHLVRHVAPHDHEHLLQAGEVLEGLHPLADIAPPGRAEFAAYAMDRIFHLPLFVRGSELFLQPLSVTSLSNQMNSALAAIHFLRSSETSPYSNKRDDRWRVEFPQYVTPFDEIQDLVREQHLKAAHRAAFRLVRSILRDAHDLMARDKAT